MNKDRDTHDYGGECGAFMEEDTEKKKEEIKRELEK